VPVLVTGADIKTLAWGFGSDRLPDVTTIVPGTAGDPASGGESTYVVVAAVPPVETTDDDVLVLAVATR
jgi:hypothetical protein